MHKKFMETFEKFLPIVMRQVPDVQYDWVKDWNTKDPKSPMSC